MRTEAYDSGMSVLFFQNKYFPKMKIGPLFDRDESFHQERGVAFQNGDAFFAISLNRGGNPHFIQLSPGSDLTLKEWVRRSFGDSDPVESNYVPGTFYKRMWRPQGPNFGNTTSVDKVTQAFVSLRLLLTKLEELFETIEPAAANLSSFGHKIREVLLLACMEVESSFAAVLKENRYPSSDRLTTADYVKLARPMLLDGYEMSLQEYPQFPSFSPFKDWDQQRPTKSLSWYDAYNKTKHDREGELKMATLENAVFAVGAAVVIFYAQYGFNFGGPFDQKGPVIRNIFRTTTVGFERYERDFYIPKLVLPLGSAFPEWTPMDYPF